MGDYIDTIPQMQIIDRVCKKAKVGWVSVTCFTGCDTRIYVGVIRKGYKLRSILRDMRREANSEYLVIQRVTFYNAISGDLVDSYPYGGYHAYVR